MITLKYLLSICLLNSIFSLSQITAISGGQNIVMGSSIKGGIYRNQSINSQKPLGSPYISTQFELAEIHNIEGQTKMRYNGYDDVFEFITVTNDTLVLDKKANFEIVKFVNQKKKYCLLNYTDFKKDNITGYLEELYVVGNYSIFKKEIINFREEKLGITSMEGNMPAKYYTSNPVYYLKVRKILIEFPASKKELQKNFSTKTDALDSFFKENKINFDDENDLKKIIDFLSGI